MNAVEAHNKTGHQWSDKRAAAIDGADTTPTLSDERGEIR